MGPCPASVSRLVDAVSDRQVGPDDACARPDIDDVGVGRSDGNRSDRSRRLIVEQRLPGRSEVRGTPHASIVEADVERVRLARHARERSGATGARRADRSPVHGRVLSGGVWL